MNNQKGFAPIVVVLIIIALITGGILVWQSWQGSKEGGEPEEGKGVAPWYSGNCEEFSIEEEYLSLVNTSNWEIREHRYNYLFTYPSDTHEWKYLAGICEDLQEINPSQKCAKKGEPEDPDSVSLSQLDIVKKKQDEIPAWYPTEPPYYPPYEICGYKSAAMSIGVYRNSAKLGLSDLCEKYNIACCSSDPNYEIGGIPAIRCTQKCIGVYQVEENLDWLSPENKKWLEENGYKPGDEVECDIPFIVDSIVVLYGDYRYVISSDADKQDEKDRAIFEGILSSFQFTEPISGTEEIPIVKQSGGAGLLIAECANESYITETADYIIEGTVEKVEVLKRAVSGELEGEIFTYSDILIGRYLKGIPFDSNKLRIETPGGCTEEICLEVEDQPIFHKGTKVRIYLQKTNGEFSIVCGQFGVTEVGEKGVGEECPIGKIYINDRCVWNFISSDNPLDYLGDRVAMTRESDWKDYQPLVKKVQELIKNKTTDREKAIAIAEWVVNSRPYGVSEPFKTVIETFNAEAGGCEEAAVLTTAMLRIADIPARVLYSGHFWTDAYFDGAWKSIDTTFGIVLRFDFNITDSFVYQYYRFFDKLPYDTQLVNCSIYKHVSRYDQDGENVMFALGFTDGDPYTPDIPIMSYFLLTTEENGQIGELKIQPLDYFPGICIDTNLNELVRYTLPETGLVYMQLPLGKKYKFVYEPLPGPVLAYIEFELKKGSPLQLTPDMLKRGEGVNQTVFEDFKKRLISEWMPGSGIEVKEIEIEH